MKTYHESVPFSLCGKIIAIAGGEYRDPACRRLERELGCTVVHFESRENDTSSRRFASLASADPDLIVWIYGRSRHAHGDHVRELARALGVPFLSLKSLPHPNRLRLEIGSRHLFDHRGGGAL